MKSNHSDIIIKTEDIGKCYRIGLKDEIHSNFTIAFLEFLKSPLKNYRKYRSLYRFDDIDPNNINTNENGEKSDIVWAIKNLSFQIKRGEVVGIIGANGAGKSTLLKILSRITSPTVGRVELRGTVASLLEVGTGFHPDLTGRENVYLNGTILGMSKLEIDRKFDEIIDFSGIERFIDTPVKRYSSGMTVRLAFSVAAHLEPEILIVDEVLAVGDMEFQRKCLGKMENISRRGRTVLFVSHNMTSVAQLCERVILLRNGTLNNDGPASKVISEYLSSGIQSFSTWVFPASRPSESSIQIKSARVLSENGDPSSLFNFGDPIKIEICYDVFKSLSGLCVICQLTDLKNNVIWTSWDTDSSDWKHRVSVEPGSYSATFKDSLGILGPGSYYLSIGSGTKEERFPFYERILKFEVSDVNFPLNPGRMGIIKPIFDWQMKQIVH